MTGPRAGGTSPVETAGARARGWELLSTLYLEGITPGTLPTLAEVPELAALLPESFDPDEAAAEHHRLFGLEVFPWASVFLARDGVLGGPVSDSMARRFAHSGVRTPSPSEAPDHLGNELGLLAALTARGDDDGVAAFLEGHLLWWLPVFVHSVGRVASPLWAALAELTLDAALEQAALRPVPAGGPSGDGSRGGGSPMGSLPVPPADLADVPEDPGEGGEGPRRLARHLVTPARSGLYLSLADIRALGRAGDVPGGFGRRELVMTNLLRSAASYGELGGVVEGLRGLADGQRRFLDRVPEAFRTPWTRRLEMLRPTLQRLEAAA